MIDTFGEMFQINEEESIKELESVNFDFDKAVEKLQRKLENNRKKEEEKKKKK